MNTISIAIDVISIIVDIAIIAALVRMWKKD